MKVKKRPGLPGVVGFGVLKMVAGRGFKESIQRVAFWGCTLCIVLAGRPGRSETAQRPSGSGESLAAAPMHANRTVPQVEPPTTVLAFSARPTAQEIFRARVFAEPLVPVGGQPTAAENSDLATALLGYAKRAGPDDFSSLTGFLNTHPKSPWAAALLTDLGLEYYNTAHYSLALDAWASAWALAKDATDARAHALADRALAELITMKARLGRMDEIEGLLQSVENRSLTGPAGQRVAASREALWAMQHRPETAFRCGPVALRSIRIALKADASGDKEILKTASTQQGCSLPQVAALSRKIGLNYQMAFRDKGAEFIVPAVVNWKVGHYAAVVKKADNLYQLQDPTFGNETWATSDALEAEASGYFLVPSGPLPKGWRAVDEKEGATVWGKGQTSGNDDSVITGRDLKTSDLTCHGMAVPSVHLMTVNLNLSDEPVGYTPPVGPPVRFIMRYNRRESFQPANFTYSNFGPKWTCDWISYVTDNPSNLLANVTIYAGGGGQRTFSGFDPVQQAFAPQQYDQTLLRRTGPASYDLIYPNGSKLVFSQPDGSIGTSRNVFLTQIVDPQGNAVTLTYDANLRIVALTDAIGQVTTLTYGVPSDIYKVTKVTDPFGRSATLNYVEVDTDWSYVIHDDCPTPSYQEIPTTNLFLQEITDVIGLSSQFGYFVQTNNLVVACIECFTNPATFRCVSNNITLDQIVSLTTPYGTTSFSGQDAGNERVMVISYPDGSRERVEYNQNNLSQPNSDPPLSLPAGMLINNTELTYEDTYYWDRAACAVAYGDHSKARLYHFCQTPNLVTTAGALESVKLPLEGRVWYDYAGQSSAAVISSTTRPAHIGRVLDDLTTQLYAFSYDPFGHVTNSTDPVGRNMTSIYDTNNIDLLEVRQTRDKNNELLFKATYNGQHRPLTATDAAGQTTTFTYNARGQVLTATDAKNETTTFTYDASGYLISVAAPLPGTNGVIHATYDAYDRVRTSTDQSGYTVTFDYDDLDRLTRVTHPDGTFSQFTYDRLDCSAFQDRAGRQTTYAHDNMRQITTMTDPLNRATRFEWCRCGAPKSITDPMGRKTSWLTDVQGRRTAMQYADGSQVSYRYENTTSRLQEMVDEQQQAAFYAYNADDTLSSLTYGNVAVPTPGVTFTWDTSYRRLLSMTDGIGTTTYNYNPITTPPVLGAGGLGSVSGPLTNSITEYTYDELGRVVQTSIDGVSSTRVFDAVDRVVSASNALGSFTYAYDGGSDRLLSRSDPNGQTASASYGADVQDFTLRQLTHAVGATPVSQFTYGRDIARSQLTNWSQQAGALSPSLFTFVYDAVNQLLSAAVTNAGAPVSAFAYSYDASANRLSELAGGVTAGSAFNALNQLSSTANAPANSRTNQWDGEHRLAIVNAGSLKTVFGYDGSSHLAYIQQLQNGNPVSFRRFVWAGNRICEERDATGTVITKRYFPQGFVLENGTNAGPYYYTRDHLRSVRELTDAGGNVRARYTYDPFGRRTKVNGDVDADFGFGGMFWSPEVNLALTRFRAYDPNLGRWLSRDPLHHAEFRQGPNLYAYAHNDPVSHIDPLGLMSGEHAAEGLLLVGTGVQVAQSVIIPAYNSVQAGCMQQPVLCMQLGLMGAGSAAAGAAGAVALANSPAAEAEAPACFEAEASAVQQGLEDTVSVRDTLVNVIRSGEERVGGPVDFPDGEQVWVGGRNGDTVATPETVEAEANAQEASQWWLNQVQSTSDYRDALTRTANGFNMGAATEHLNMLTKMHDLLFFPSGK